MCFKKNVLSSVTFYHKNKQGVRLNTRTIENIFTCQNITNWHTAKNLIYVDFGSNHLTWAKLPGVNWSTARLILPLVVEMSLKNLQNDKLRVRDKLDFLWSSANSDYDNLNAFKVVQRKCRSWTNHRIR